MYCSSSVSASLSTQQWKYVPEERDREDLKDRGTSNIAGLSGAASEARKASETPESPQGARRNVTRRQSVPSNFVSCLVLLKVEIGLWMHGRDAG